MKTGILTFHRAYNYGAFLQALALKSVLESLGEEVFFVDYWPEAHAQAYKHSRNFLLSLLKPIQDRAFQNCLPLLGVNQKPTFKTSDKLSEISCDNIIFGSDQIWWNSPIRGYEGVDKVYFGEGFKDSIRKIAYAPSVGTMNGDSLLAIKDFCPGFSGLSARESELSEILSDILGQRVPVVLDPVLLAGRDFWEKICKPSPIKGEYIAYYRLFENEEADHEAERLSKETGLRVIRFSGGVDSLRHLETLGMNPLQFVSLIKNARYVISNSFHGVAFSILFGKEYFYPKTMGRVSRITSLISALEEKSLDTLREESLSFLKTALGK